MEKFWYDEFKTLDWVIPTIWVMTVNEYTDKQKTRVVIKDITERFTNIPILNSNLPHNEIQNYEKQYVLERSNDKFINETFQPWNVYLEINYDCYDKTNKIITDEDIFLVKIWPNHAFSFYNRTMDQESGMYKYEEIQDDWYLELITLESLWLMDSGQSDDFTEMLDANFSLAIWDDKLPRGSLNPLPPTEEQIAENNHKKALAEKQRSEMRERQSQTEERDALEAERILDTIVSENKDNLTFYNNLPQIDANTNQFKWFAINFENTDKSQKIYFSYTDQETNIKDTFIIIKYPDETYSFFESKWQIELDGFGVWDIITDTKKVDTMKLQAANLLEAWWQESNKYDWIIKLMK